MGRPANLEPSAIKAHEDIIVGVLGSRGVSRGGGFLSITHSDAFIPSW